MEHGDSRRPGALHDAHKAVMAPMEDGFLTTSSGAELRGLAAPPSRNETKKMPPRVKIHMHPAKRRLLLVLALGSVLGCILMVAMMRLVVMPLKQWHASPHHDAVAQLERLRLDMLRLRDTTVGSTQRMKEFLLQMQRVHASSTSRTALVEKAAAQSYREHARDHIREHFMAIKEGILVQTSQRRRIDDAREELLKMGLTADALLVQLDSGIKIEDVGQETGQFEASFGNHTSASSSLAKSIRSIRLAMLEHSIDVQNATKEADAQPLSQRLDHTEPPTAAEPDAASKSDQPEHGVVVYLVVFGLVGVWMWSVLTDERTRKTSLVFHTHRAVWKMMSGIIVVERVDKDYGDEFLGMGGR